MTVDEILNTVDESRAKIDNFRGSLLWYSEGASIASVGWMRSEMVYRSGQLFSDILVSIGDSESITAHTAWANHGEYTTTRAPEESVRRLIFSEKELSHSHRMLFNILQIDCLGQETWSQSLGQIGIIFAGEELYRGLLCLRLEWRQMTELDSRRGHWLLCPERDYKIVYEETYTSGTEPGIDAEIIEIKSVEQFQKCAANWVPVKTVTVRGHIFSDGRREMNPMKGIMEVFDFEIGTVEENESMLTPPLTPEIKLNLWN